MRRPWQHVWAACVVRGRWRKAFLAGIIALLLLPAGAPRLWACTTAVISGRVTADGRPLLWKNRDTRSTRRNEVDVYDGERYRVMAVFDAGNRAAVWMGANSAGLCIENALSRDLATDQQSDGIGNGGLMKRALETCATVEEFKALLEDTDLSGRKTTANFGAIDAHGGAAVFEVGPRAFEMFDANDPRVAPRGYLVRTNFSTTALEVDAMPESSQVEGAYSAERFARGCELVEQERLDGLTVDDVIRRLFRDLADEEGCPFPGTVNGEPGDLPPTIAKDETISRTTTVSAAVFHGVRPGEDPLATTMWVALGDPLFSIAVPCWVGVQEPAEAVAGDHGGAIGEISNTLREWSLTSDRSGVHTQHLPQIWRDVWDVEDRLLGEVANARRRWQEVAPTCEAVSVLHQRLATEALVAMQQELADMKDIALALQAPPPPTLDDAGDVRVAIHDDASERSSGSRNLLALLTPLQGMTAERITSSRIRNGDLSQFDVLIMPGGSGSGQSARLEESGRSAIRSFVSGGGGYVGICAGAYLATSHYDWSLGLINARVWDRAHWARGGAEVVLEISDAGRDLLESESLVNVYYHQGPLLVPDDQQDLPGYEVLASFKTEVAQKGAQVGAMVGTHAIIRSMFGRGRVISFSPHPEAPDGPHTLILQGVRWAGKLIAHDARGNERERDVVESGARGTGTE